MNAQLAAFSKNFLYPSKTFEPFVPNSQQNTLYALTLLGNLAEITRQSFQSKVEKQNPPQSPVKKEYQPALKDASLIEALLELRTSNRLQKRNSGIFTSILRVPPHDKHLG